MPVTTIYCKYCHQRLFDLAPGSRGCIEIKCSRCRRIIRVSFTEPASEIHKDYLAKE